MLVYQRVISISTVNLNEPYNYRIMHIQLRMNTQELEAQVSRLFQTAVTSQWQY